MTDEFPAQRASNAENISIWWRHHDADQRLDGVCVNAVTIGLGNGLTVNPWPKSIKDC